MGNIDCKERKEPINIIPSSMLLSRLSDVSQAKQTMSNKSASFAILEVLRCVKAPTLTIFTYELTANRDYV